MIGTVLEPHFFDKIGDPAYPNNIKVDWDEIRVKRDSLSLAAKNSLGSVLTVFRVDKWGE
jgi:restriction system protein